LFLSNQFMEEDGRIDMGSHALCQTIIDWFQRREIVFPSRDEKPVLIMKAECVRTLEEEIENGEIPTFQETIILFSDIAGQLNGLERIHLAPCHLSLSSISVVHLLDGDRMFILSPRTRLYDMHDRYIEINHPFRKHMFMSPELVAAKTLPIKLSSSGATYSLGVISYYCLAETIISSDNKSIKLAPIAGTPLSAAIERTIHAHPGKRRLLYI